MPATNEKVKRGFTFRRGVHPPASKQYSAGRPIQHLQPKPGSEIVVPLVQHIGAPCEPTVAAKDTVTAGQVVGDSPAFISAPVHSPVNGAVKAIELRPHPSGRKALSVVITVAEEQPEPRPWKTLPANFDPNALTPQAIYDAVRNAGIVGHGGAAFPTAVKLKQNPQKPVDTVLLNGCECEPYLTCDDQLMREAPDTIVAGLRLVMQATAAKRGIIALEDNKPQAIESLTNALAHYPDLQLAVCKTQYPQGGERQLIKAVLNRTVPTLALPLEVGAVVVNTGTAAAIAFACAQNRPAIERVVAVTGAGATAPGNYRVPVGMLVQDLLDATGPISDQAQRVLLGGPMTGPTTPRLDVPILKGTSGITILTPAETAGPQTTACIRCARCVDACPVGLVPTKIAHAVKADELDLAEKFDLMACIECGCCTFVCPAGIPLVQYLRSGKLLARQKAAQNKKK